MDDRCTTGKITEKHRGHARFAQAVFHTSILVLSEEVWIFLAGKAQGE